MDYFQAALNNDTETIIDYLKSGNVNIVDTKGASLLHYAARGNAMEVAKILITNYINLNICDQNGETALFEVVRTAKLGFIKLLLRYHADLNIINRYGETLLFRAIMKGNQAVMDLLLENGDYDLSITNLNGENLLFYALKAQNNDLFIKYATNYPHLLKTCDYYGCNLLMKAIYHQNLEIVMFILKQTNNYYYCDKNLNNIFFYAARYGNYEIVKFLLDLKPILSGFNKDKEDIMSVAFKNTYDVTYLFDNYLHSSEYKFYLRTYPFHAAVVARNYDLLDCCNIDIKKRDMFNISLLEYIKFVNDDYINKLFKLPSFQ